MFAHFDGHTLAALIIVPSIVVLGFAAYANRGITPRYTVRRGYHVVSRHWTEAKAHEALNEYALHNESPDVFTIQGR